MDLHKGMVQARRFWRVAGLTACLLAGATAAFSDFVLTSPSSRLYYTHGVLAGGRVQIAGGTRVVGDLHANGAVHLQNGSTVEGDVSAAGKVTNQGTVTGEVQEQVSPLALPALQSDAELRALADRVLTGNQTLNNAIVDDVLFIQGDVRVTGTLDGEGTIIATGKITVESGPTAPQEAKTRLSLIARGDIRIDKERHFRGVLYAGRDVDLQKGLQFQGVVVAGRDLSIDKDSLLEFLSPDAEAPSVTLVRPQDGAVLDTATPTIEVGYTDALSGIDLSTVQFLLDGTDRTAEATVGAAGLTFTPSSPLADGPHTIEVTVADNSGNEGQGSFTFTTDTAPQSDPPVVTITQPSAASTYDRRPAIRVEYAARSEAIDLATLAVRIDGIDVTPSCTAGPAAADCESLLLAAGPHRIDASLASVSGAVGTASFAFELRIDEQAPVLTVDSPVDGRGSRDNPVQVRGTATDDVGVAAVTVNGQAVVLSGSGAFSVEIPLRDGSNFLLVRAVDASGNAASRELVVYFPLDETPPQVALTSLVSGSFVAEGQPAIDLSYSDASGIAQDSLEITVNGQPLAVDCELGPLSGSCRPAAPLPDGAVSLVASVADVFGNRGSARADFRVDTAELELAITVPAAGAITREGEVAVQGTVSPGVTHVVVNGLSAPLSGTSFSATVPLRAGTNMIVAIARKASGRTATASVEVTQDLVAPIVRIDSPRDGLVATADRLGITGLVNDVVTGGVAPRVLVNGVEAVVGNGTFMLEEVQLVRGPNVIEAVGRDAVGNEGRHSVTVHYEPLVGARLSIVSGNGQAALVRQTLPAPVVVAVTDELGNPLAGRVVRFQVIRNSGEIRARAGDEPSRVVQVPTDGSGRASVLFTLGDTAGEGNNRVLASVLGAAGEVELCASALPSPAAQVIMAMGDNQRGAVGQPLPMPLIALVVDGDGNPVPGVDVRFTVTKGGGSLDGVTEVTRTTGVDGLARAVLTLGMAPGIGNNAVAASIEGLEGLPAKFTAGGLASGDPASTRFSGVVMDNANTPIPGAEVTVDGTGLSAVTDASGQFRLHGVPVGHIHLHIDPSVSPRPETFPPLAFETVTVAGQDNNLGQPILIPALDMSNSKIVGGSEDVTLTMDGVEGLSLTVFANSATFPGGLKTGRVTISQVHFDKVPMAPPGGTIFMPPTWTIQPHGVHFDPPARITIPNNGLPPGRMVDIFQFDHHLNQFINVGKGTVSEDGATITSDPGFGITAAGWGGGAPPPPPPNCADGCPKCQKCDGTSCVPDDGGDPGGSCSTVSAGGESQTVTGWVQSALRKVPFIDNVSISGEVSAEQCPVCCKGSPLNPGEVTFSGSVTGSAEFEKFLSPVDFEFEQEVSIFGQEIEVEFEVGLGPFVAGELGLTVSAGGKRDFCQGKNCFTAHGCGSGTAQVGGGAKLELEVEVNGSGLDIEVQARAFGQGGMSAGVEYDGCGGGLELKGCVGELTGNIEVEFLFFSFSREWTFFDGFGECCGS